MIGEHTINIPIMKSVYVAHDNPYSNYSTSNYLLGGGRRNGDTFETKYRRYYAYLGFDTSLIPKRKDIKEMSLYIYFLKTLYKEYDNSSIGIGVAEIKDEWNEKTINFDNCPNGEINSWSGENLKQTIYANTWHKISLFIHKDYTYGCVLFQDSFADIYMKIASSRGTNKPYVQIVYEDVPPDTPNTYEPSGVYIDNTSRVNFTWSYNCRLGGKQKKFDLYWSSDNGTNWHIISRTTSSNYYNMSANTLPAGTILWKVRTYNEYDEVSECSKPLAFYCVGTSPRPTIKNIPSTSAKPKIEWGSLNQQVYELELKDNSNNNLIYSHSGTSEKTYTIPLYLKDSTYKVRIRIKNKYDLWSLWGERTFKISTDKPDKPKINAMNTLVGITFTTSNEKGIKYTLYRKRRDREKYIPVNIARNGIVNDNTVANNVGYNYFIRAIHNNAFSDSDVIVVTGILKHSLFSSIGNLDNVVVLRYSKEKEHKDVRLTCKSQENFYTGRSYQVTEYSPFMEKTYNLIFYVKTIEELIRFRNLLYSKNVILFRDKYTKEYGNITNIKEKQYRNGFSIEFTFKKTNHDEEIEV